MNPILEKDLFELITNTQISWSMFAHKTFLITGATGFLGSLFVKTLLYRNQKYQDSIHMILIVRNIEKARSMFPSSSDITYIESSLEDLKEIKADFDYVIHCASPTRSKFFITHPVETMDASILGTKNLLDLCKEKAISKFLYLSSMEMYGVLNEEEVDETKQGYIDLSNVRSSYSLSKRTCELYCQSYFHEYHIPVTIARLAMCFGAGISKEENRVYKYFLDCVFNHTDIEVRSSGKTIVNFVYAADALKAMFLLLQNGGMGEAYNVVADSDHLSIMDMANYVASFNPKIKVVHNNMTEQEGFAPENQMILSNQKIKQLGFESQYNLKEALKRTLEYMRYEKN